ncbi:calcium-transporting ATPase 4, endoplasmic reticulum-type-like [Pyrus x bretschneideri]|uniref:calcium-transporting ATPase 4, endoplasmic reticulum-type-like n=1 Tax=Pyrus x bretschneideri TaxID=225117 RepID=UPI00202E4783|nr:calcium-transporting ATPase 4, endoplasmic reticulum-type-like [Pyrus x bretschneideri]
MTTNQMVVAKLVALRPRPIILLKFRVDGIIYNPLDGEILNWPTGQMDANLQMIAKKYVDHGMPTEAAPKFSVEKMVLSEESKGVESFNGRDLLGCCQKWSEFECLIATLEFDRDKKSIGVIVNSVSREDSLLAKGAVENFLEKSTKVQLLDGTVVPLDDSSRTYIVQALHEMSTSALKPLMMRLF